MWLFTTFGMFSIVRKPGDTDLTVRSRVAADLDALRAEYLPDLSPTLANAGSDYRYRATVSPISLASAMVRIVGDLTYSNFKDEVTARQGHMRHDVYTGVWSVLHKGLSACDSAPPKRGANNPTRSREARPPEDASVQPDRAGGVLIDQENRVLLRKPTKHYGGLSWTFYKGQLRPGESLEDAALREVLEETGFRARIVAPLERVFRSSHSATRFFVMSPQGRQGEFDTKETQETAWFTLEEAERRLAESTEASSRVRDLEVLDALREWMSRR